MAGWITHTMIADQLMALGFEVDPRCFVVGNVAPDCNVENDDWTSFEPSREVMHWMSEYGNKLSADYQGFYQAYISDRVLSLEEYSFLIGYYVHLIVDLRFQRFVRQPLRIQKLFARLKSHQAYCESIRDYDEDFDNIKQVFGKGRVFSDIDSHEAAYLKTNTEASYLKFLKELEDFPDYLPYLPKGAIPRKIKLLVHEPDFKEDDQDKIFFPKAEFEAYLQETIAFVMECLSSKTVERSF